MIYRDVPKVISANLDYRERVIRRCSQDHDFRRVVWSLCARDLLYWVNTFCWTYDPRKMWPDPSEIPFVTWPVQDMALMEMFGVLGRRDIGIEKSRDMGASWLILLLLVHEWQFSGSMQSFLVVSRKEDLVDSTGDPDSLFWKIDFLLRHQPKWMVPSFTRTNMHLGNDVNGCVIDGASTTGDTSKGGRRTAIMLDEFAAVPQGHEMLSSTADVTNCRIFNSTPQGTGNAFYDVMHPPFNTQKVRLHWSEHPDKSKNLYWRDGRARSPWYDEECNRRHPQEVAQNLDIDYLGSDYQFFENSMLDSVMQHAHEPVHVGELDFDPVSCRPSGFHEVAGGRLDLWCPIDREGMPPTDRNYVIAADVAAGTGASNSCLSIGDCKTQEKMGQFVSPNVSPEDLAKYAVSLARLFRHDKGDDVTPAFMIWEANGPGRIFGNGVIDQGFRNIYYRRNEKRLTRDLSDYPGWYSSRDTKMALLGEYRRALKSGDLTNRSRQAILECRQYVYMVESNTVEHSRGRRTIDPSGAKDNHGDIVIADALCWKAMKDLPTRQETMEERTRFCFAARRARRLQYAGTAPEYW